MEGDQVRVRVSADELPLRAQLLLDSGTPRPPDSRFLVHRSHSSWIPAAWLVALLVVGIASLRSTLAAGMDAQAGAERIIYGTMAAICLVCAVLAARKLLQGLAERRAVRRGDFRQGLHVLGLDGLLIAGRDRHTWVPRAQLPAADVTGSGGGNHVPSYAFIIADDRERVERLDCGAATKTTLWLWAQHGSLPEGSDWR